MIIDITKEFLFSWELWLIVAATLVIFSPLIFLVWVANKEAQQMAEETRALISEGEVTLNSEFKEAYVESLKQDPWSVLFDKSKYPYMLFHEYVGLFGIDYTEFDNLEDEDQEWLAQQYRDFDNYCREKEETCTTTANNADSLTLVNTEECQAKTDVSSASQQA